MKHRNIKIHKEVKNFSSVQTTLEICNLQFLFNIDSLTHGTLTSVIPDYIILGNGLGKSYITHYVILNI